jgi:hypothetical protein
MEQCSCTPSGAFHFFAPIREERGHTLLLEDKRRSIMRKLTLFGIILGLFLLAMGNLSFAQCYGDFNCDGDVDGDDFAKFVLSFGETNCGGDIYVDVAIGQDLPTQGGSPDNPAKTIAYAISRASCCCGAIIQIAPGIYNENLLIQKDKISLKKKDGAVGDVIINGGSQDVITIDGAKGIVLGELNVVGGNVGIYAKRTASISVHDFLIDNTGKSGIAVTENSNAIFERSNVQNSNSNGAYVSNNSAFTVSGDCYFLDKLVRTLLCFSWYIDSKRDKRRLCIRNLYVR